MTPEDPRPMVSVVMPVCNEALFLDRSLSAVLAQDYPPEKLEVLVADGMSQDGTRALVAKWQRENPAVRLIDNPGRFVAAGLNAALREAKGAIVVRVDGHCEIARDYVTQCVRHLQSGAADGVGGSVETIGETGVAEAIAIAMSIPLGVGNSGFRTLRGETREADTVPFPAYRRELLEQAGPFDEELVRNQDDEYNYRLRKRGARLLLAGDVHSRYYSRSSLRSLWRQYFQYGYWKVRVLQKHPLQMRPRQFAPPLFVLAVGVSLVAAGFGAGGRWALASLLGLYAAVNVAGSVAATRGRTLRVRALVPVACAILHFAYGSGFLTGLVRFWNRWTLGPAFVPAEPAPQEMGSKEPS